MIRLIYRGVKINGEKDCVYYVKSGEIVELCETITIKGANLARVSLTQQQALWFDLEEVFLTA